MSFKPAFNIRFANNLINGELPEDSFDWVIKDYCKDYSKYINVKYDALYYKDATERILKKLVDMLDPVIL